MTAAARHDGREPDQLRPVRIELGVNVHAEGSCLIEMGRTRVWITATVDDRVPPHRRGTGHGWVTAEYSMLPRSTHDRGQDRKSTRLNSSHMSISYAVFCLKKKKQK